MSLFLTALAPPHSDDLESAQRMLSGDSEAFDAFFETSFDGLFRFALGRLDGDESLAQDMVQATLAKAFERLDTYRGDAALFTWLCSICRSEISHHFRRAGRSPVESFGLLEQAPEIRGALEALAAEQDDACDETLGRELVALVHMVLDQLPTHYSQVLEWKYLEGLAVKEIASRLTIGAKAAESLLTRSRDAFRKSFQTLYRELGSDPATSRFSHLQLVSSRNMT